MPAAELGRWALVTSITKVGRMKIRALFLAANPLGTDRLQLDEEIRAISEKIRSAEYRDIIELVSAWAVRPDDLLQLLNQYKPQIVHFSGHGSSAGEIVLVDNTGTSKPVNTSAIRTLFRTLKDNIRLVVLNACYSRIQATAIIEAIDCAVGMNTAIGDKAAIIFAASFYRALGFGRSVQEAFEQGKTALLLEGIPEENTPDLLCRAGINASQVFIVASENQRSEEWLHVDDVLIEQGKENIKLDVRVRNSGKGVVNLTRADLHILERRPYPAVYRPSASYDLLLADTHNVIPIAHTLQLNEVDRFIIRVGFTEWNTSCGFTAQLILHYNGKFTAMSKPFRFSSTFRE